MAAPLLTAVVLAAALGDAAAPATGPVRLALVVGNNTPLPGRDAPLRYADDDAYKSAQVLAGAGVEVWLHARFDAETAERAAARGAVGVPRPPTMTALRESLLQIRERVAAARAAGQRAVFYFWYAGHGDIIDGEGAVALEDGLLRRSQLWGEVVATPQADLNHVIVDACRAYFVVFDRGRSVPREPIRQLAVSAIPEALARRTGVVLSTTGGEQTFEWEAVRSGVFGHEIRSGLSGAADIDGDGQISYLELAAFVDSANAALPDPAYRPTVTIRPPAEDALLVDLAAHRGVELVLERDLRQHLYVEDALGMRWLDLHPDGEREVRLRLPPGVRPGYLVAVADRREIALRHRGVHQVIGAKALRRRRAAKRGAAADAFEHLFGRPHGPPAYSRFSQSGEGNAASTPYADMVAELRRPGPAPARPARPAPRPPTPKRLAMVQREANLSDRLPFATGGASFVAEPPEGGETRHVKLFHGDEGIPYERFALLTLPAEERQRVREETSSLYTGDRVRAWLLVGGGSLAAVAGTGAAVYAFAAGVPLQERLIFGMGGINIAVIGALTGGVGIGDHLFTSLAEARRAKIAIDPARLEAGLRRYNEGEAPAKEAR